MPSRACDAVELEATMSRQAPAGTRLVAELSVAGRALASASVTLPTCSIAPLTVPLREMVHGQQYEELLWSPEHPLLIDAQVRLHTAPGTDGDEVSSYLEERLARVFGALHASEVLSGFCYTQLTDTMQEANGLADERRRPKTDVERIRAIVVGTHPTS